MYESLLDRIRPVTRRFRAFRFWWLVSLLAILFAFLAFTAIESAKTGQINGSRAALGFASAALVTLLVTAVVNHFAFRNPRSTAAKIENQFPSLDQRLFTALDQGGDPSLGYLQQRVIREARDHSRRYDWATTLPGSKLWCSRLTGFVSVAAFTSVLGVLWSAQPTSTTANSLSTAQAEIDMSVSVEPGNVEIERGTSLTITARFTDANIAQADLICLSDDGSERRITMRQNLADPIVGGFIAAVDDQFQYRIETQDWTSETYSVDVFEFPSLVRSDAGLDFPEYTQLQDKVVEDTVRVSAVEGTKVKWLCFLNKPVASGELVGKDGERIQLERDPNQPGALSTQFDLDKTKRFTLELVDSEGRKNKYPPELVARVLPNNPPKLKLANAKDAAVSPLEELPLGVEVRDDFGIAQVGLSYTFASQPQSDVILQENIGRGQKQKIEHLIAMEELDAEPDQLLAYHFWAEDIGPDGNARRTESDMYFAEVRPFEEIFREGEPPPSGPPSPPQSPKGQEAEKLAELQKEIINATWTVIRSERGEAVSSDFAKNATLLGESQADALSQLEELAAELEDEDSQAHVIKIRDDMKRAITKLDSAVQNESADLLPQAMAAEQSAYAGLLKLRAREFQITRQQQKQNQSQSSGSQQRRQKQLDDLELDQEENRYETQQQAQANSEEEQQQRETRQVLNRLRELARRQEDLNKQLAELQSALEQAESEEERQEVQRQLKRLRDQQQDLLRETDELSERMKSPENAETMSEESEKLDQTRENVRKATEALQQEDAAKALTAGKRAERELEEMRDDFRRKTAGEFNDTVRQLRSTAQELNEKQEQVGQKLQEIQSQQASPGLRSENNRSELEETIQQQREKLSDLLEDMQDTVQQAEEAEPLLAQKLYDSFRKTQQRQIDRKLSDTSELLKRGFDEEARKFEEPAREGIQELTQELEQAAESVLGDETEGLRRALGELDQLSRDLDGEIQQSDPDANNDPANGAPANGAARGQGEPTDADASESKSGEGEPKNGSEGKPRESEQDSEQQRDKKSNEKGNGNQPADGEPQKPSPQNTPSDGKGNGPQSPGETPSGQQPSAQQQASAGQPSGEGSPGQQPGQGEQAEGQKPGEPKPGQRGSGEQGPGEQGSGQQGSGQQSSGLSRFAADSPSAQPLTGEGFRDWSDRLRDVEEMVADPELRSRAAKIRDRAREVRVDVKRNSKDPQWRLVEDMIAKPLRELRRDVQEELIRRSAEKNALVPIDRDPVPEEFTEAVQKYYESLGSGR